jgi:hypothetical protein
LPHTLDKPQLSPTTPAPTPTASRDIEREAPTKESQASKGAVNPLLSSDLSSSKTDNDGVTSLGVESPRIGREKRLEKALSSGGAEGRERKNVESMRVDRKLEKTLSSGGGEGREIHRDSKRGDASQGKEKDGHTSPQSGGFMASNERKKSSMLTLSTGHLKNDFSLNMKGSKTHV